MNLKSLSLLSARSLLALPVALACACGPAAPDPAEPGGGGTGDPCEPESWQVTKDLTLTADCSPYSPAGDVVVENGATLEIEAGVEVRFGAGAALRVGDDDAGRLVATGTADDPVRLVGDSAGAGHWAGVVIGPRALFGNVLDDVEIEDGGAESAGGNDLEGGCLTHRGRAGAVSVRRSAFRACAQSGVSVGTGAFFAAFEDNTFAESAVGVDVALVDAVALGTDHTFDQVDANVLRGGLVDAAAVVPAWPAPWNVDDSVVVGGDEGTLLVIDNGATLRFASGAALEIGTVGAGGLMARGTADQPVTLEAQDGSWGGIVFGFLAAAGSALEHAVVKDAGEGVAAAIEGCVSVDSLTPGVVGITDSAFEGCDGAGVVARRDGFLFAGFARNSFTGTDTPLRVAASVVGSVGDGNTFPEGAQNRVTGGSVTFPATWKSQGAPWVVEDVVDVGGAEAPAYLTLDSGLELLFEADAWLAVGGVFPGGLVAVGAEGSEVVLGSAAETPAAGDWVGVLLGPSVQAGTRLEYVEIHDAGRAYSAETRGCVTVQTPTPYAVSIQNSTFDGCQQAAVAAVAPGFAFALFDDNTFTSSDAGLWVAASAVGTVGMDNSYSGTAHNVVVGGTIDTSALWVAQDVPWDVDGSLEVGGATSPYLNLWAGVRLRFAPGEWLRVGNLAPGGLVVEGLASDRVVFEAQDGSAAGSWVGLVLASQTLIGTSIDSANIRHAGEEVAAVTRGAVSLSRTGSNVSITDTSFTANNNADVFIDCDSTPILDGNSYSSAGEVNEADCPPVIP